MPTLEAQTIPDLIQATLDDLQPMTLTDLTTDVQEHVAFNRLMKKSQVDFQSGLQVRINIMTASVNNARFVGLYQTDGEINQQDVLDHGSVPWRFSDFNWAWDEREIDINNGQSQIQDYVKTKRQASLIGWAEFIETWFWGAVPATTDVKTPYPLRYWIVKSTSSAGFNGGAPTGSDSVAYTSVGGISPSTYSRWKNYTAPFTNITEEDLIQKWRTATRKVNFRPPVGVQMTNMFGTGLMYEHYTNESNYTQFESLGDKRNDNLGYDFAGQTPTFARAPVQWVPKLDNDTDDPIYSINWGRFKTAILKGKWMRERPAMQAPFQHNVWVVWVDSQWNMICSDRRSQAVLSRSASYTGN